MKTIVVPVNFRPASNHAARYAADMAAAIGGKLNLIHVFQMPPSFAEYPMPDGAFDAFRDSIVSQMKSLAADLVKRTAARVPVETDLELGGIDYKLQKYCRELAPFAVVIGRAGSPLDRFISGSTTLQALRHLPYPLLIVPEQVEFERPERILLACDLEDIANGLGNAPPFLHELKNLFGADFQVINVTTSPEEGQGQAEFAYSGWKARLKDIYPDLHFVHTDTVGQGIDGYLRDHPADWLVVFPKKHALYELHRSQAKKIVLHTHLPVLSIHE